MGGQGCLCRLIHTNNQGKWFDFALPLGLVRLAYWGSLGQGLSFGVVVNADQLNHCIKGLLAAHELASLKACFS